MHKKPCLAPWRALAIGPDGTIQPDVQFVSGLGNIDRDDPIEVFEVGGFEKLRELFRNGVFPEDCSNCKKKEESIGHSRRQFFFDKLNPKQGDVDNVVLEYLDLNISNFCNLKCRMCNSVSSSSWIKEDLYLNENYEGFHRPRFNRPRKIQDETIENLLSSPKLFQKLKYLSLRGGEPLLESNNIKVLKKLVEWRIAKDITLDLSTNGSQINQELISILSHFKSVEFHLSIESSGPLYSYIRGGDSFGIHDLEKNIPLFRNVPNLQLIFTITMSIYNILSLSETLDWFEKTKVDTDEIVMSNTVVRPEYLNYQILPNEIKEIALEKLSRNTVVKRHYELPVNRLVLDTGFEKIKASLKSDFFSDLRSSELRNQFVRYNQALDKLRGTSLLDYIPEFSTFYSSQVQ